MFDFLSQKFSGVLSWLNNKSRLSNETIADAINQVRDALFEADVPEKVINDFLDQIKNEVVGTKISERLNAGQQFIKIVHTKLVHFLEGGSPSFHTFQIPSIIMVMGLQGSGKTTSIAKLAYFLKSEALKKNKPKKILTASVDYYRPAAIDQLEILAQQCGVDFLRASHSNPVKAAQEIMHYYKSHQYDYLLLDTAGRLQTDHEMIQELKDIASLLNPRYKLLILDAMTGQESLKIAETFNKEVGFEGALLTKVDSDTRGGAAFAFKYSLQKPILFVGSGEKIDDLEAFIPRRMANRILGMGDILSLIEKAENTIDSSKQEEISRRLLAGNFTLKDFASQLDMVNNMGSLQKIMKYMPGMPNLTPEMIEAGSKELKIFKAILSSMTKKEVDFPSILDASRKKRIAFGSGTSVSEVNKLLDRFEQSKQFAKMCKRSGMLKNLFK